MSTDRPTFSDSWYRVAQLRPRLRAAVQTHRQHFRGQTWHVLRDLGNDQYFRLSEPAYRFIGMLDGRLTVDEAWRACAEQLGDDAPTQGEAVNVLGQLHAGNLLQSDLPADAAGLFERQRRRIRREVTGQLRNLLFLRFPLLDPDAFLTRLTPVAGWLFGPVGWALWLAVVGVGLLLTLGRWEELAARADPQVMLDPTNLALLYACFTVIKAIHETGHGVACKRYGRLTGTGGEVHVLGLMLMILTPVPYVDASSSWTFRNKWHRAFVGAAGMYVELPIAALAAVVWAHTPAGPINTLAYNVVFVASFSTLLFNANPLLRFDGYYILSDLLELPNLAQRSQEYVQYLVKRYVFGVKRARSSVRGPGERPWFVLYAVLSNLYRAVLTAGIILYISDQLFLIGTLMAISALAAWLLAPTGKFIRYLATDPELARTRPRAVAWTIAVTAALAAGLGAWPVPDRERVEGVVEPRRLSLVYAQVDGFVRAVTPSGRDVDPMGQPLLVMDHPELRAERIRLTLDREALRLKRDIAVVDEPAVARALEDSLEAIEAQVADLERRLSLLEVRAPVRGVWLSPGIDHAEGSYVKRGQSLGMVASASEVLVRAVAGQAIGPRVATGKARERAREAHELFDEEVELRVRGRPDLFSPGRIEQALPAGLDELPSAALGYLGGGTTRVDAQDSSGRRAAEPVFELRIAVSPPAGAAPLLSGQRVVVRLSSEPKPIAAQAWRALRQLLQERLQW